MHGKEKDIIYDFGIFLDDKRILEEMISDPYEEFPECREWISFTNIRDIFEYMDQWDKAFKGGGLDYKDKTIYVTFDHYLGGATTGKDAIPCTIHCLKGRFKSITFKGHSSDPTMNEKNEKYWEELLNHIY